MNNIEKLNSFRTFGSDWDGYEALPINDKAIDQALEFLDILDNYVEVKSYPLSSGCVVLAKVDKEIILDIEFDGSETFCVIIMDRNKTIYSEELKFKENDIKKCIDNIKEYL